MAPVKRQTSSASKAKKRTTKTAAPGAKKSRSKKAAGARKSTPKKAAGARKPAKAAASEKSGASRSAKAASKPEASKPKKAAPDKQTAKTPSRPSRVKALPKAFLIELAEAIRDAVFPAIVSAKGREVVGQAQSGDMTFELDRVAEKALLSFLKSSKLPLAYYSEDEGYATFSSNQPENLLVVDPIDGTRAAKSGFESCVVAVCSTRVIERPRMADVDNACVLELLGDRTFYAERGKGARIYVNGRSKRPKPSTNANLETVSWSMTTPGRPAELIFPTAAKLMDLSSLKGGFFACNSTSYSLTRLLTNQLDACVDLANRYLRDIPELVRDQFINAGRGAVLGIAPYDLAASLLVAQEAGCVVTDAYGKSFDEVLLLDSGESNQRSLVAAANDDLHAKLMSFFEARIKQYERLLRRRAKASAS